MMNFKKLVTFDIEIFKNYALFMFYRLHDRKFLYFEQYEDSELDKASVINVLKNYTIITFNGNGYDMPMTTYALRGHTNRELYDMSRNIIQNGLRSWQTYKQYNLRQLKSVDHIDLIEVCPLKAKLKIYAGRIHVKELEDLPLPPDKCVTDLIRPSIVNYCKKDNTNTAEIYDSLKEDIDLRYFIGDKVKMDLRSKSDAQMAESILKSILSKKYKIKVKKRKIEKGFSFRYEAPDYLNFKTPLLQNLLSSYKTNEIRLDGAKKTYMLFDNGKVDKDSKLPVLDKYKLFKIGDVEYKSGVGGLHSREKSQNWVSDHDYIVREYDASAFYPFIILNNNIYPPHIGPAFLKVYNWFVNTRLIAKKENDETTNMVFKILINGTFGKLGSAHSFLFSPELMSKVTITGQLSLLMLIEKFELNGIGVISANTDGIVVRFKRSMENIAKDLVSDWEFETGYEMEKTDYKGLYCRDVNNYVAVKSNGEIKGKGDYARQELPAYRLSKNPTRQICVDAVHEYLGTGKPVEDHIRSCNDIKKFICLRLVNGGATQDGKDLGSAVRWYYSNHELDCIRYIKNNNKVPKSDGATPILNYPTELPKDLDYDWYIEESKKMINKLGVAI